MASQSSFDALSSTILLTFNPFLLRSHNSSDCIFPGDNSLLTLSKPNPLPLFEIEPDKKYISSKHISYSKPAFYV